MRDPIQRLLEAHVAIAQGFAEIQSAASARVNGGFLDEHFTKQEQGLFPMAREVLGTAELAAVADEMAALEAR